MYKYALLINPGHNRIYFETSKKLAIPELTIALNSFDNNCSDIKEEEIQDIAYITFCCENELSQNEIDVISKLSFVFAFYEIIDNEMLKPIKLNSNFFIKDSLSSILKYTGKTNELFTRMMINVALLSASTNSDKIKILDPIAGKGTTLFESLIYGYDAYGIEISDKSVAESFNYLKKYLQIEKYKHDTFSQKVSGPNKSFKAVKYEANIAKSKEDYKNKTTKHFEIINSNSVYADKLYKKNFFDIIVGDLPYGVQHGNVSNQKQSSFTRNPYELVSSCVPHWKTVLKPGGTIVLAWNSFVLKPEKLALLLEKNGLEVLKDEPYLEFEHRVDQAIKRDIIVAKKLN